MTPETQTAAPAMPRPAQPSTSPSTSAGDAAQPQRRRRMLALLVIAAAAVAGFFVWRTFAATPTSDAVITLSGRIEADEATVGPNLSGRILEVRVHEGDTVKAGEIIAILADDQVRAREDQARAALQQSEARARAARDQVAVLQEQLRM